MADKQREEDLPDEEPILDALGEEPEVPYKYSITAYGADYPVDGLVKRLREGDIFVPPFQRSFVWSYAKASRFIESLLLGLPVPGIFLSRERDSHKLLVIDGQQRLKTLLFFYDGLFEPNGKKFSLKDVQNHFLDATYKALEDEDRRRLDDSILHATIVQQDQPSDDNSSVYHIFERLNTGGVQLQPQEIRACIFHGQFNDTLGSLNKIREWREIYGPPSKRMRDRELILRFLALHFNLGAYERPMKEFLNAYMGSNKNYQLQRQEEMEQAFGQAVRTARAALGKNAFRPERALNAAVYDAVMVALARRLQGGPVENPEEVNTKYEELLRNDSFVNATGHATADEENVKGRIRLATEAFAEVR